MFVFGDISWIVSTCLSVIEELSKDGSEHPMITVEKQ